MNEQIKVAIAIEIVFVVLTFTLLNRSSVKAIYHWAGTVMLCLTFCWSVLFGCLLALHDYML